MFTQRVVVQTWTGALLSFLLITSLRTGSEVENFVCVLAYFSIHGEMNHRVFVETLINFWNKIETRKFEDQILNDNKFSNLKKKKKKQNVKYLWKKFYSNEIKSFSF